MVLQQTPPTASTRLSLLLLLLSLIDWSSWIDNNDGGVSVGSSYVDGLAIMMVKGGRGGKRKGGGVESLRRTLDGESASTTKSNNNKGLGQEITGVTLPPSGQIKGWEFGERKTLACANVNDKFYGIQGDCPRCGFDLWKGDIIDKTVGNEAGFEELPRVACPTCSTTYSLVNGKRGPKLKRTGLSQFVSNLATQATNGDRPLNAQVFQITRDENDGRVFCRSKSKGPTFG